VRVVDSALEAVEVKAGTVIEIGAMQGRAYLAVAGGFDVPLYLGSRSTFLLGKFGGHAGRALRAGDVLHLGAAPASRPAAVEPPPQYGTEWEIGVLYGPHGAPDFFTEGDIEMFFSTRWKVHHNSDRTGIRLIGPKPVWARADGGEAGLHPSNIHDNAYAIGTIDFTGDMPVDPRPGRSEPRRLRVSRDHRRCRAVKMGQLKPGDLVRFVPVRMEDPVLRRQPVIRADGDRNLLIEYGPNVLDLEPALSRARARTGTATRRPARHPRYHAGRPLAAGPLSRLARSHAGSAGGV
jgi:urea carboxylase